MRRGTSASIVARLSRAVLVGTVLAVALVTVLLVPGPGDASACSYAPFTAAAIPEEVERAGIVAIGTWVESSERVATLEVEDPLKGTKAGATLSVDNRTTYAALACSPYDEPFREGYRFAVGERWVVMLDKEVDGLWQVSYNATAAWEEPSDDLQPLFPFPAENHPGPLSLEDLRAMVNAPGLVGRDLGAEGRTPCNRTAYISDLLPMASTVVRARVLPGEGSLATVQVIEWLAGEGAREQLSVNFAVARHVNTCEVLYEPGGRTFSDEEVVLLLRPDEFGVADARPVVLGPSVVSSNDRWLTFGAPTLKDIRFAAASAGSSPGSRRTPQNSGAPPEQAVVEDRSDSATDGLTLPFVIASAAVVVLAIGAVAVRRLRPRPR